MSSLSTDTAGPRFGTMGKRVQPPTIARLMTLALENRELLSLAAGFTDSATLPMDAVAERVRHLCRAGANAEVLQYGSNGGRAGLRTILAERLRRLEPTLEASTLRDSCLITNGSQQALYLAMQVLCDPGDIVLVDRPTYFVYLEMLGGLGIEARSIPVDSRGRLDGAALRALLRGMKQDGSAERLKAVYFVSYYSNPSGRSLTTEEKTTLAQELEAQELILPVLEDAAYRELYYEIAPEAPSVLTLPAWSAFPRMYLSTLTKPFASGLKVGYAFCTDEDWRHRMLYVKGHQDFGTANFNQAVYEQVLSDGAFDDQLQRIRGVYLRKMRVLNQALENEGLRGLGWRWQTPGGGLYLWLEAPATLDTGLHSHFCRACIEAGVLYVPGELCFGDEAPSHCIRLSFGVLSEPELQEAASRFVATARRFTH